MNGILIVAHGAENANDGILRLRSEVESSTGIRTVVGFKRYGEPKLGAAMDELAAGGADTVAVIPLFMSDSKYSEAIPRNLGLEPGQTEGTVDTGSGRVRVRISGPLGMDPGMGDVVRAAVAETGIPPETGGVVLLAHGGPGMRIPGEKALADEGYAVRCVAGHGAGDLPGAIRELESEGRDGIAVVQVRMTSATVPVPPGHLGVVVTGPVGSSEGAAGLVADMAMRLLREER